MSPRDLLPNSPFDCLIWAAALPAPHLYGHFSLKHCETLPTFKYFFAISPLFRIYALKMKLACTDGYLPSHRSGACTVFELRQIEPVRSLQKPSLQCLPLHVALRHFTMKHNQLTIQSVLSLFPNTDSFALTARSRLSVLSLPCQTS